MTPNMQVDPYRDPDRLFPFTLRLFLDLATREVQEHDVRMRDAETEYWYEFGPKPNQTHSYTFCESLRCLMLKVSTMASKAEVICLLLLLFGCFFVTGSVAYCFDDSDCGTWSGETCCSDNVCRQTCGYCYYNSQCGTGESCCDDGDCSLVCTTTIPDYTVWTGGVIAAAVIGTIVFFVIIISIVACCCCACCPCYRHRSPGTVIVSQPGMQPFVTTTQTSTTQQMQQYPPPGNYYQPPQGYAQPPPPYPSYPQQPGQYPPPQAQGQPPMPPPVSVGEPVKY